MSRLENSYNEKLGVIKDVLKYIPDEKKTDDVIKNQQLMVVAETFKNLKEIQEKLLEASEAQLSDMRARFEASGGVLGDDSQVISPSQDRQLNIEYSDLLKNVSKEKQQIANYKDGYFSRVDRVYRSLILMWRGSNLFGEGYRPQLANRLECIKQV